MKIEKIIYDTTRGLINVEDKLKIGTIFIFCYQVDSKKFAELLYTKNHIRFIKKLDEEYKNYEIDLTINLNDKNINKSFIETLEKVKEKYDNNGYYKALYDKDAYAVVIYDMVNDIFNYKKFDKIRIDFENNVLKKST